MSKNRELALFLESNFNFDISPNPNELDSNSAYFTYLKKALSERIKLMINTDMDRLLQALYRIDVNDRETDRAFSLGDVNQISNCLAELIIRRQLQKMEYSRDFSGEEND